jgi:hypothetical protein
MNFWEYKRISKFGKTSKQRWADFGPGPHSYGLSTCSRSRGNRLTGPTWGPACQPGWVGRPMPAARRVCGDAMMGGGTMALVAHVIDGVSMRAPRRGHQAWWWLDDEVAESGQSGGVPTVRSFCDGRQRLGPLLQLRAEEGNVRGNSNRRGVQQWWFSSVEWMVVACRRKSDGGRGPPVLGMGQTVPPDGGEREGEGWSARRPLDQSREGGKGGRRKRGLGMACGHTTRRRGGIRHGRVLEQGPGGRQ